MIFKSMTQDEIEAVQDPRPDQGYEELRNRMRRSATIRYSEYRGHGDWDVLSDGLIESSYFELTHL